MKLLLFYFSSWYAKYICKAIWWESERAKENVVVVGERECDCYESLFENVFWRLHFGKQGHNLHTISLKNLVILIFILILLIKHSKCIEREACGKAFYYSLLLSRIYKILSHSNTYMSMCRLSLQILLFQN